MSTDISSYYDQIASLYDATRAMPPEIDEQVTEYILNLVSATPETKFLEPGIGTGLNALPIIQRGYSYTGIDISKEMMDELRRKLQNVPNNLTLIHADASSLNFPDKSFDVVLMRHMLHLIPDWRRILSEILRVLKFSGFYLYCESIWTPHQKEFEQQWREILVQQKEYQPPTYEDEDRAGIEQVKKWLIEQGATIETVIAAEWKVEQTVGELLDIYQTRNHATCWLIPEYAFPKAMQYFRNRCQKHYGSLETILSSNATFGITVVRAGFEQKLSVFAHD
ncbi:MAG: class I SAM-dependent methyltransferase [Potamolinea sp.]